MKESSFNSETITNDTRIRRENVTCLSIFNMSEKDMTVTHNGVQEVIPPYDVANRYARSFDIMPDGTYCYVDIDIKFESDGIGTAILRFKNYNPKTC